jgi:hypothetical protein
MKTIRLIGISFVTLAFLLTINITLNSSNGEIQIKMDEKVEAVDDYVLCLADCPGKGIYWRCEKEKDESCDVHAQTVCPEPE